MKARFVESPLERQPAAGVTSGLRRRLLVMLIAPLIALAVLNAWFDYSSASGAALEQDQRLLALVPLLGDSIIPGTHHNLASPVLLPAPAIDEFLSGPAAAFAVTTPEGRLLLGADWLTDIAPATAGPEFISEERGGITWRIVRQRQHGALGDVVVALADGSDPRQQWARAILTRVLLPNVVLIAFATVAVRWGVARALRPLLALREAVERRSPRDLSPIDSAASPEEVRPLVNSLNRLFGLVDAQAEGQRRFIADAAHQLRTPLAALQAQVEAWAQAANAHVSADASVRLPVEEVNKLRGATRRTSQLASQLLALSRADSRAMDAQPMQRVDLKALGEDILAMNLDAASAKNIDLGIDARPVHATGHAWLLRELLSNLVDNAVKYTPAGGTVTIRCGRRSGQPYLEVEDDGPGIAPAQRAHVVERFYRVQGTQGEGNGLGLAIADEIARGHHGQLELATGVDDRGLRVTFTLPA